MENKMKNKYNQSQSMKLKNSTLKLKYFLILIICFVMIVSFVGGVRGESIEELKKRFEDNFFISEYVILGDYWRAFIKENNLGEDQIRELWSKLDKNYKLLIFNAVGTDINTHRTDLLLSLTPTQQQELLQAVARKNNSELPEDFKIAGLDKLQDAGYELKYENDFLIISKSERESKQEHKIPLTNLPEDFKEISFKENNNLKDDYGIFYYDNNDNSVFVNDGSWIEKHGAEASKEEKAYGKWIVKAEDGEKTKTIGYLYPGTAKGNIFQVGIAKAGEKRDIELPGLHIWYDPSSYEMKMTTKKEPYYPHITAFDKQKNQVSIFPPIGTGKEKMIKDKYYAGFDPETSRVRGEMILKINKKNYPDFGKDDEIKDFSILVTGENDVVVTTDKDYTSKDYKVLIMAPTKYTNDETIGYIMDIPENYEYFNLKLRDQTKVIFNGAEVSRTEVKDSEGKLLYYRYSTGKESTPRAGAQALSGSGRVGNSEKGHWEYEIRYRSLFGRIRDRQGPLGLRREVRVPVKWIPEGISENISPPVRGNVEKIVEKTGKYATTDIEIPTSETPPTVIVTPPTSTGTCTTGRCGGESTTIIKNQFLSTTPGGCQGGTCTN